MDGLLTLFLSYRKLQLILQLMSLYIKHFKHSGMIISLKVDQNYTENY